MEVGTLTTGHAKALLSLSTPEAQLRIARVVAETGLSVRETEKLVEQSILGKKPITKTPRTTQWADLEDRLQKRLGTKVTLQPQGQGGKLIIHYFSPEELDGVVESLLG